MLILGELRLLELLLLGKLCFILGRDIDVQKHSKNGAYILHAKISQIRKIIENKSYNCDISSHKQSVNLVLSFLAALLKEEIFCRMTFIVWIV